MNPSNAGRPLRGTGSWYEWEDAVDVEDSGRASPMALIVRLIIGHSGAFPFVRARWGHRVYRTHAK